MIIGGAVIEYESGAAAEAFAEVGLELASCGHRAIIPSCVLESCRGLVVDNLQIKIIIFDIAVIVSLDLKADIAVGAGEEAAVDDLYLGIAVVTCQSYIKGIFKTAFYRYIGEQLLAVGVDSDIECILSVVVFKGCDGVGCIVCGGVKEPCAPQVGGKRHRVCSRSGFDNDLGAAGLERLDSVGRQTFGGVAFISKRNDGRVGRSDIGDTGDGAVVVSGAIIEYQVGVAAEAFVVIGKYSRFHIENAIIPTGTAIIYRRNSVDKIER